MNRFPAGSVWALILAWLLVLGPVTPASAATSINGHSVVTDSDGKIVSWLPSQNQAYDAVTALAWNYLLKQVPDDPSTGQPAYLSQSYLNPDTQAMAGWPNNPAGMHAMLIESAIEYNKYSGNSAVLAVAQTMANQHLSHGMTLATDNWANVPYASGDAGSLVYSGASYGNSTGVGDGAGYLEPDKVAELGYALLLLFEATGNTSYRAAAVDAANALASHVRAGTSTQSPWPFRVNAQTGAIREQYSAHVISAIELFDELDRLGLATAAHLSARNTAWTWMMAYPMKNNAWSGYFEDVAVQSDTSNTNQLNAMMVARYLLRHPDKDPDWETHVRGLISWVESTFGVTEFGATTIMEQQAFMHAMGSHTSRYASVNALLYARTGDLAAKEKAYRAFNWATYMARSNGVVIDGPSVNNQWFTDGYGDYIRHFLVGMFAVPEWAPMGQTHLLDSSSVVTNVTYGAGQVSYTTFDSAGIETIKTAAAPTTVTVGGKQLALRSDLAAEGWTYDPSQSLLKIRHDNGTAVAVAMTGAAPNLPPVVSLTAPSAGTSYAAPAAFGLAAVATDLDGAVSKVEFYQDGTLLGQDTTVPYQFSVSGVTAGSHSYFAKAYDDQGGVSTSLPVTVTVTAAGDTQLTGVDIGSVGVPGSTTTAGGVVTVQGGGTDIWGTSDGFQFAYRQMSGDGSVTARVTQQQFTDAWAKAGVMVRESLDASSRHALLAMTPGNGVAFQTRTITGGTTSHVPSSGDPPYWLRLTRAGTGITAYTSADGVTWSSVGSSQLTLGATAYVGLAVTSHDNAVLGTAVFDNVSISAGATTDTTPPVISDVASRDVNQNGATVSWTTNEPATSQVDYGTSVSYGSSTALNTSLDTAHTQVIAGLAANTTYHYRVRSSDAAGNSASSGDRTFATPAAPDIQPPTAPTDLRAVSGVDGSVRLSWTAATDDVGVVRYDVRRDGVALGASTTTGYVDSTVKASTTYSYVVVAVDAAGNVGPASNTATLVTPAAAASSLALDTLVVRHGSSASTSLVSPALTTAGPNELIVAFVTSDGPASGGSSFATVSGGGLSWTLRTRVNSQAGTAEVWTAPAAAKLTNVAITATPAVGGYSGSLVVAAVTGADLSAAGATAGGSAASGAPTASVTTTRAGSWIWAAGNDWDSAVARTAGSGQTVVDEYLTPEGDSLWVQRQTASTPAAGTKVTINDVAPTTDKWNLALYEILPAQ
ncbi:MAG: fibronectin type III domain-containing protein [Actinobacteria bacterium]|nr:fibronectin type III domain-containing protein [Actinomycetota bacterium]